MAPEPKIFFFNFKSKSVLLQKVGYYDSLIKGNRKRFAPMTERQTNLCKNLIFFRKKRIKNHHFHCIIMLNAKHAYKIHYPKATKVFLCFGTIK